MNKVPYDEVVEKILTGLKRHDQYIVAYGKQMHDFYPPAKVDDAVLDRITVPIPLKIAMMMFGLAASMLAIQNAKPGDTEKDVTPGTDS